MHIELEKKINKYDNETYCVFLIKIFDKKTNIIVNEIYTSINIKHGLNFDKYNLFINKIKSNKDAMFENNLFGNIHKISYYKENIIFKTEFNGVESNYTLIRIPINEDIINVLYEIDDYLKNIS